MCDIIEAMGTVAINKAMKKIYTEADVFHELYRRSSYFKTFKITVKASERRGFSLHRFGQEKYSLIIILSLVSPNHMVEAISFFPDSIMIGLITYKSNNGY